MNKEIQRYINETYRRIKKVNSGKVADYIPELAKADPNLFGIAFVSCDGDMYEIGDSKKTVSIQSISKVFTLAKAVEEHGINEINMKIGNEGSSLPFNSVVAAELSRTHTINPFVNQGAIATTSLLYDKNTLAFKNKILNNLDDFAGKHLKIDTNVYRSEMNTNHKNMALSYLLKSYNRFYGDVDETVDVYTQQCSKLVSARNLATMACVFAKGGIHPNNNKRIIKETTANYVYRSLRGEGLYEYSGKWNTDVGSISAKSGVGGGVFIILKGVGGIGITSPPLDRTGNSVKGIKAGTILSNKIYDLHLSRAKFCGKNKNTKRKTKTKRRKTTRKNK